MSQRSRRSPKIFREKRKRGVGTAREEIYFLVNRKSAATDMPMHQPRARTTCNRNAHNGQYDKTQSDEDAGELSIDLHHAEGTRMSCVSRCFTSSIVARFTGMPADYGSLKSTVTRVWKSVGSPLCQYGL